MFHHFRVFELLISSFIWNSCLSISLNVNEYFDGPKMKQSPFTVPTDMTYEITAGGACGGGTSLGDGGNGGMISGLFNLTKGDIINVAIGDYGKTKSDSCGTAGGGGATLVFVTRGANAVPNKLVLVAPGGGGAGYGQTAISPDYTELNSAVDSGSCLESDSSYAASPGRSLIRYLHLLNLTYNPTTPNANLTAGCLGGYGGGGQGGFMLNLNNYTIFSGGGGGGGGYVGGQISVNGKSTGCTAGGPGKPFCEMTYCGVAKPNPSCNGFFIIRKHELYKELPLKDRTNYEKPKVNQNVGLNSHIVSISLWCLMASITLIFIYRQYNV